MLNKKNFLYLLGIISIMLTFLMIQDSQANSGVSAPLKVVVTFSILKDFVEIVGGDNVDVQTIVPPNVDPHTYQPKPEDAKNLNHAQLVIINGLGFEGWLDRLIAASGFDGPIITAAHNITPRPMKDNITLDPHAWHNVGNAILYVKTIMEALKEIDPDNKDSYDQRGSAYCADLTALDLEIKSLFADIPESQRRVVTTHDAFWYFGDAYGVEFLSPVGISTESQASAADVARLIDQIRDQNIRAVFLENLSNQKLIYQIAEEADVVVSDTLYADSLSEQGGPASTYIQMMRHNASAIAKSLS